MKLSTLTAISPIDGRYGTKTDSLRAIFSEYGLIRYRVIVEVKWLQALAAAPEIVEVPMLSQDAMTFLEHMIETFDVADAERVKSIEQTTNHDVKAVEYFIKTKFDELGISEYKEFIHFGFQAF